MKPDELPAIGSPSGTNFIVELFDYTCPHCRALHPLLKDTQSNYPGLRIVTLPVPLDAFCNSLIMITEPGNKDACEYAKIALAVWHVRPKAFAQLNKWIFAAAKLPPVEMVRAQAEGLIGRDALQTALNSRWVDRQLQIDISLYQANAQMIGDARLPQLMVGGVVVHGAIESKEELSRLIDLHLHVAANESQTH